MQNSNAADLKVVHALRVRNRFEFVDRPSDRAAEYSIGRDFDGFYRDHQALVRSVIFEMTGGEALDDLVQESFIKIWQGLPAFRNDAKLTSWIYRVTVNHALDFLRRRKRSNLIVGIEVRENEVHLEADSDFTNRDLVEKGLMSLTESHRSILVLTLLHDISLLDTAAILEISEGTAKSRLHYAKLHFRGFLARNGVSV